jgi:hypothetical protein
MRSVLIDPHGDDAALFASFLCLRHKPLVVVTHRSVPKYEIERAMIALCCKWEERPLDRIPEIDAEVAIVPAWEREGLHEHNLVADFAADHLPLGPRYMTYAGHPRQKSRSPNEVEFEPEWLFAKHRALAAFESQAATPSWFHFAEDMREYVL